MVQAASMALASLKKAILQARYDADPVKAALLMKARLPDEKKGKSSTRQKTLSQAQFEKVIAQSLPEVDAEYWAVGEGGFYNRIQTLPDAIIAGEEEMNELKIAWVRTLRGDARAIFNRHGQTAMIGKADPKKIAYGHRTLRSEISIYNPALREKLGLVLSPPVASGSDKPQTGTKS